MPIRIMLEDAAGYDKQMRRIQKHHRNRKDLHGDEFLGGFSIRDKVYPVITICIYYGDKPYDGAKELYQIMEYETLPDKYTSSKSEVFMISIDLKPIYVKYSDLFNAPATLLKNKNLHLRTKKGFKKWTRRPLTS